MNRAVGAQEGRVGAAQTPGTEVALVGGGGVVTGGYGAYSGRGAEGEEVPELLASGALGGRAKGNVGFQLAGIVEEDEGGKPQGLGGEVTREGDYHSGGGFALSGWWGGEPSRRLGEDKGRINFRDRRSDRRSGGRSFPDGRGDGGYDAFGPIGVGSDRGGG